MIATVFVFCRLCYNKTRVALSCLAALTGEDAVVETRDLISANRTRTENIQEKNIDLFAVTDFPAMDTASS